MTPSKAAWGVGTLVIGILLVLAATMTANSTDGFDLGQTLITALIPGLPLAFAAAATVRVLQSDAGTGDVPERLVNVATTGLPSSREEWGPAMKAELSSIEGSRERWRFAAGCVIGSLRITLDRRSWLVAIASGGLVAATTLAASRLSLAGGRAGIIMATLYLPAGFLFLAGVVSAWSRRSFRSGLVTGGLALVLTLVAWVVMAMSEGTHWQSVAGVFLMDGDRPKTGLTPTQAALDPVSPPFLLLHLLIWLPWPVLGALLGAGLSRQKEPVTHQVSSTR